MNNLYTIRLHLDPMIICWKQKYLRTLLSKFAHGHHFDGLHVWFRFIAGGGLVGHAIFSGTICSQYNECYILAIAQQPKKDIPGGQITSRELSMRM